jgi:uncharacterized protein YodC (DUF2158 family)
MRIRGAVLGLTLVAVLAGCAAPAGEPTNTPTETPTPTPTVEVAPVGEAAIPLGCSDLLAVADVANLGADFDEKLSLAIDENRIAVDMSVSELQQGALRCIWAARYGSTDFHAIVEVTVAPSAATELVPPDVQYSASPFVPLEGDAATLYSCSDSFQADESSALYNSCDVVQLRAGYRIELATSGLKASAGQDSSVAAQLIGKVDAAVDAAGPARVVEPVSGTSDPASVCLAPEIAPALEYLGAAGDPVVAPSEYYPGVTDCKWTGVDAYGNQADTFVYVLPGGGWAIPRLATGVASIFMQTHPSADGTFLIGIGDGLNAWKAVGDDLVAIYGDNYDAHDGWEAFLESTW